MNVEERARRVGHNEALFRAVNERIEELDERLAPQIDEGNGNFSAVCECSTLACTETVRVPRDAYERTREQPERFILVPGHEMPDVESVVDSGNGYIVVEKTAPEGRTFARATDPHS